ncbi:MAG: J domain-containing protein [bacterium]
MITFKNLDEARRILGLDEEVSLEEIKEAYHNKAKKLHPDKGGEEEQMKRLNQAYKLLISYCSNYKISFRQEDYKRANPDVMERFMHDWMWGDGV